MANEDFPRISVGQFFCLITLITEKPECVKQAFQQDLVEKVLGRSQSKNVLTRWSVTFKSILFFVQLGETTSICSHCGKMAHIEKKMDVANFRGVLKSSCEHLM